MSNYIEEIIILSDEEPQNAVDSTPNLVLPPVPLDLAAFSQTKKRRNEGRSFADLEMESPDDQKDPVLPSIEERPQKKLNTTQFPVIKEEPDFQRPIKREIVQESEDDESDEIPELEDQDWALDEPLFIEISDDEKEEIPLEELVKHVKKEDAGVFTVEDYRTLKETFKKALPAEEDEACEDVDILTKAVLTDPKDEEYEAYERNIEKQGVMEDWSDFIDPDNSEGEAEYAFTLIRVILPAIGVAAARSAVGDEKVDLWQDLKKDPEIKKGLEQDPLGDLNDAEFEEYRKTGRSNKIQDSVGVPLAEFESEEVEARIKKEKEEFTAKINAILVAKDDAPAKKKTLKTKKKKISSLLSAALEFEEKEVITQETIVTPKNPNSNVFGI